MNILFITPSIPTRLHRIRAFELIKTLSGDHNVHLVSFSSSNIALPQEIKDSVKSFHVVVKPLWRSLLDCILFLFSPIPLEVTFCRSKKMNSMVKKIIDEQKIDLVYVKRLRSAQYLADLKCNIPVILDTTDAMSLFYKRAFKNVPWYKKPLFAEEYFKYLLYEKKIAKVFGRWVACSEVDAGYLRTRMKNLEVKVIPNIIDAEYFKKFAADIPSDIESHSIMFSGLMDKFVNIEAADFLMKEIYPKIIDKYPDLKIYIVGPNPVTHIMDYNSKKVIVTGYVDDIRKYLSKTEIVVCPVRTGTGIRNKILQAWAMEKPVISTSAGFEGLAGENGREILIADDAETFAKRIVELFENDDLKKRLGKAGREMVEAKYSRKTLALLST